MLFWVFVIYNRSTKRCSYNRSTVGRVGKGNAHTGVRNAGVGNTMHSFAVKSAHARQPDQIVIF